jgi:hypothetical protein
MDATQDPRSLMGALRFVADLSAAAVGCTVAPRFSDELTARRRRRAGAGVDDSARAEREVKAL